MFAAMLRKPKDSTTSTGGNVTFYCDSAKPSSSLDWYWNTTNSNDSLSISKNGLLLSNLGHQFSVGSRPTVAMDKLHGNLTVMNVTAELAGMYWCGDNNGYPDSDFACAELYVCGKY